MVLSICEYSHPIERSLIMNSKNEIKFNSIPGCWTYNLFVDREFIDFGDTGDKKLGVTYDFGKYHFYNGNSRSYFKEKI